MQTLTQGDNENIKSRINAVKLYPGDFCEMSKNQITLLIAFINNGQAAAKNLNKVLDIKSGEFLENPVKNEDISKLKITAVNQLCRTLRQINPMSDLCKTLEKIASNNI